MTKNVVFYARYSTDRQNEQSIETQKELFQKMVAANGWKMVETFKDSGVSGMRLKTRPGIQAACSVNYGTAVYVVFVSAVKA